MTGEPGYLRAAIPLECDDRKHIIPKGGEYKCVETHTRPVIVCRECYEAAEKTGTAGSWE